MLHFIKYILILVIFTALFLLLWSNQNLWLDIKFAIPYLPYSYIIKVSFIQVIGICFTASFLFAAFIGALRLRDIRQKKKELKKEREELNQTQKNNSNTPIIPSFQTEEESKENNF